MAARSCPTGGWNQHGARTLQGRCKDPEPPSPCRASKKRRCLRVTDPIRPKSFLKIDHRLGQARRDSASLGGLLPSSLSGRSIQHCHRSPARRLSLRQHTPGTRDSAIHLDPHILCVGPSWRVSSLIYGRSELQHRARNLRAGFPTTRQQAAVHPKPHHPDTLRHLLDHTQHHAVVDCCPVSELLFHALLIPLFAWVAQLHPRFHSHASRRRCRCLSSLASHPRRRLSSDAAAFSRNSHRPVAFWFLVQTVANRTRQQLPSHLLRINPINVTRAPVVVNSLSP